MKKVNSKESNKSLAFTESKSLRDDVIHDMDYDFLDKMKVIPYLTSDMALSVAQAAKFYDASKKSVETIIARNREEFEDDGMIVLSGDDYKKFLEDFCDLQNEGDKVYEKRPSSKARSITLLPKKSLLRIGMIMTNNLMARKVRDYLINIEEEHSFKRKSWLIQREVGIIERKRCMSAVARYVPNTPHKKFAYPNYTNMIYKILFGHTAKELKEIKNVESNKLRDSFTEDELKILEEAETIVAGLLAIGFSYQQIYEALKEKYTLKICDSV